MSFDHPQYDLKVCLYELSKNMKGKLKLRKSNTEHCAAPACVTLKTMHGLNVQVKTTGSPCDSVKGMKLDGKLVVKGLVHGLVNDGLGRHAHVT